MSEVLHHFSTTPMAGIENVTSMFGNQVVVDVVVVGKHNHGVGRLELFYAETGPYQMAGKVKGRGLEIRNVVVDIADVGPEAHQPLCHSQ